jgi:hypothetical protein
MKEKVNKGLKNKISVIQAILTIVYVVSLLISNIITSKQVLLPFNITMRSGIYISYYIYIK